MSTVVQVLPSTLMDIPHLTDRAIVDETDISTFHHYAGQVKEITKDIKNLLDPDNLGVFSLTTSLPEGAAGSLYEYSAGPFSFKIQDESNDVSLQTFYGPPLFAPILIDSSRGTLDKGISATLGPSDILDGTVNITKGAADKYVLQYDVTIKISGGKHYRGEISLEI